jgi:hypothetical protein
MQDTSSLLDRIKSRKFLLVVAFTALVVANNALNLGITEDQLQLIRDIVALFIGAEGVADAVSRAGGIAPLINQLIDMAKLASKPANVSTTETKTTEVKIQDSK